MTYPVNRIVSLSFECICGSLGSVGTIDSIRRPASLIPSRIAHLMTKYQNHPRRTIVSAAMVSTNIAVDSGMGGMVAAPVGGFVDCPL